MTTPTYTPEQLREVIKSIGTMTIDEVIRAHAAALADLAAALDRIRWYENAGDQAFKVAERAEVQIAAAQSDIQAYRGSLGYSVSGSHDGRLSDGTLPTNGIAEALHKQLAARDAELAEERRYTRSLVSDPLPESPLRDLGAWLADQLDSDKWANCEANFLIPALAYMAAMKDKVKAADELTERYSTAMLKHKAAEMKTTKRAEAAERKAEEAAGGAGRYRWIPVTERLPQDHKPYSSYAVVNANGPMFTGRVREESVHPSWWNHKDERGREFDGPTVTHWMPMPEPPAIDAAIAAKGEA